MKTANTIILTVGWYHVALPFSAKLVDALATVQAEGFSVDTCYVPNNPARWVADKESKAIEVRVVRTEEVVMVKPEEPEAVADAA